MTTKTLNPAWATLEPGTPIRVGYEEHACDGYFVRVETSENPIYAGGRFLIYTETPGGPERTAGLTYYRGDEEAPRTLAERAKLLGQSAMPTPPEDDDEDDFPLADGQR